MRRILGLAIGVSLPVTMAAQVAVPLKPMNGRVLIDSVVRMTNSVRELRDGRVLVGGQRGIEVFDFAAQKSAAIGGINGGAVYRWAGDSTLVRTARSGWIVLVGANVVGPWQPRDSAAFGTAGIAGTDTVGDMFAFISSTVNPDSLGITRYHGSGPVQQIGALYSPGSDANADRPPYQLADDLGVAADGWIAVPRVKPYRVDWRAPNGEWVRGLPIPYQQVPVSEREKLAFMSRTAMLLHLKEPASPSTISGWPKTIPPTSRPSTSQRAVPTADGKVLVLRTPTADAANDSYDVVNRKGDVERTISLGHGERIVGAGAHGIYVAVTDTLGPRLERRPWP